MIFFEKKQSTLCIHAHTKKSRRASLVLQSQYQRGNPQLIWAENTKPKRQFSYVNHSFIKCHFGLPG